MANADDTKFPIVLAEQISGQCAGIAAGGKHSVATALADKNPCPSRPTTKDDCLWTEASEIAASLVLAAVSQNIAICENYD
jgi:hypothetical protein